MIMNLASCEISRAVRSAHHNQDKMIDGIAHQRRLGEKTWATYSSQGQRIAAKQAAADRNLPLPAGQAVQLGISVSA